MTGFSESEGQQPLNTCLGRAEKVAGDGAVGEEALEGALGERGVLEVCRAEDDRRLVVAEQGGDEPGECAGPSGPGRASRAAPPRPGRTERHGARTCHDPS